MDENLPIVSKKLFDRIEILAERATKGPWYYDESNECGYNIGSSGDYVVYSGKDSEECIEYGISREADAEFIAELDPLMARNLVRHIRLLDKTVDVLAERVVSAESSYLEAGFPEGYARGRVRQVRYEAKKQAEKELEKCQNKN